MDAQLSAGATVPADEGRALSPSDFRRFAGQFATGVAVVTAKGSRGETSGVTINAVTSLSLDPPLYLVCLDNGSNTLDLVRDSRAFALHFLAKDQSELSCVFASKQADKFAGVSHAVGVTGSPIIQGVLAVAECVVSQISVMGDHTIVIAEVKATTVNGGEPLLYHRGAYAALGDGA
ncbi:flavin reductase family protein [Chelatococcus sambhunathii]|uniref:Flavin reductase family protein n=1 Tax=Chelatococcus sambhunathii TaxID=363953 RepID=A0ABU1DF64_9HYPH|nr:flavin reductase family protein [Chelatococcus sambhunathii]MDR4306773.1 flavin reductase family protein [Chelatococcus sambhunathii]